MFFAILRKFSHSSFFYGPPYTNDNSASFSERVNGINNMFLWVGTPGADYSCFQLARQDLRICFFCGELSNSLRQNSCRKIINVEGGHIEHLQLICQQILSQIPTKLTRNSFVFIRNLIFVTHCPCSSQNS